MPAQKWDTALYQEQHNFVWKYGESLIELLSPKPGDRILDLGCGTGQLTQQMAEAGAEVMGIDADATMIRQAQEKYPWKNGSSQPFIKIAVGLQIIADSAC